MSLSAQTKRTSPALFSLLVRSTSTAPACLCAIATVHKKPHQQVASPAGCRPARPTAHHHQPPLWLVLVPLATHPCCVCPTYLAAIADNCTKQCAVATQNPPQYQEKHDSRVQPPCSWSVFVKSLVVLFSTQKVKQFPAWPER